LRNPASDAGHHRKGANEGPRGPDAQQADPERCLEQPEQSGGAVQDIAHLQRLEHEEGTPRREGRPGQSQSPSNRRRRPCQTQAGPDLTPRRFPTGGAVSGRSRSGKTDKAPTTKVIAST
jgi:hypothetical protein